MAGINCTLDTREDATYDILINKDRTLNQQFVAYFESGGTEYNFVFTSYTGASLQVRKNYNSTPIILEFSTDDGSIVLGNDGAFSLIKSAADLEIVRAADYIYDMYLNSASAPKRAFLSGKFTITDRVTI